MGLDDEPDQIDGIVEDLEDADDGNGFFKGLRLSPTEYSWLARRIDKRVEERRTDAAHLVEANVKVHVQVAPRNRSQRADDNALGTMASPQCFQLPHHYCSGRSTFDEVYHRKNRTAYNVERTVART